MEQAIIILIVIVCIISIISLALIAVLFSRRKTGANGVGEGFIQEENNRLKSELIRSMGLSNTTVFDGVTKMSEMNERRVIQLKEEVALSLKDLREDNNKQLLEMRKLVDERLNTTLNERFNQSFSVISERIDSVTQKLGEVQSLTAGVTDLKRLMNNVKLRGVWGEVMLADLLQEILVETQFERQFKIAKGEDSIVDFAVKLPGKGDDENVYLPIDSKFPAEDYIRLQEAAESADEQGIKNSLKALKANVVAQAYTIRDKYVRVPRTTDFAIMYLPTEGLYSEVIKDAALVKTLRSIKVLPAGPTSLAALLNSLKMGFDTLLIQKNQAEIFKIFLQIKKDLASFNQDVDKILDSLEKVTNNVSAASKRGRIIEKKIGSIALPDGEEINE